MRAQAAGGLAAAVVLLVLCVGSAAGAAPSSTAAAQAFYAKLLKTPYAKPELPAGFTSAAVSKGAPSSNSTKYHAVGIADVEYKGGPDVADVVIYYVFPSAADAQGDLTHPNPQTGAKIAGKVPGISLPSLMITGSITGKNSAGKTVTNGVTGVAARSGSVIVSAATVSDTKTTSGNLASALALLKSALAHVAAVKK